ncbi:uncharacterized protein LOC116016420 [Ipomoea triloba]|uniref:uncharacterized protein LOC116016420 n=1 Tax=Ipomoea triloba TaxID=35885 RepID=UPI00125E3B43|nr:uncharacterized protein LOC116016420 [Ipomoea triloba]
MYPVVCGLQSKRGSMAEDGDCHRRRRGSGPASEVSVPAKRQRGAPSVRCLSQLENADEDFVDVPNVVRGEVRRDPLPDAPDVGLTAEQQAAFPTFTVRVSHSFLVDALEDLTSRQRKDIIALGFSSLLDLKFSKLPTRLGRWLLANFDPTNMCINLGEGEVLPITEEDVTLIMGFPRGRDVIYRRDRYAKSKLLAAWLSKFGKTHYDVKLSEVSDFIRNDLDCGEWFQRHFMMLMISTLISCMGNEYCNQAVFHHLDDVEAIPNLNWSRFLLEELVSTHAVWRAGSNPRFTGLIIFLILLYFDRVWATVRVLTRSIPTFRGLTWQMLSDRQSTEIRSGGFGTGVIECLFRVQHGVVPDVDPEVADVEADLRGSRRVSPVPSSPVVRPQKSLVERLADTTGEIARSILTLVQLVNEANAGSGVDVNFQ